MNECEIIHRLIRQIQEAILERECGLDSRDRFLEVLDGLLEHAQQAVRELQGGG